MQGQEETWAIKGAARVHWPVVVSAVLGVVISVSMFIAARTWEKQQIQTEFTREAQERVAAFERELIHCLAGIEQFGGFFAGSEEVTRTEFGVYAQRLGRGYIRDWTVKWVPRIVNSDRLGFEASVRSEGVAGFVIREADAGDLVPARERQVYFPIEFVEPIEGRQGMLGVDLGSMGGVAETLARATDSGEIVVSRYPGLGEGLDRDSDTMAVLPVYRPETSIDSLEDRRRNLEGFVVGTFRFRALLEETMGPMSKQGIAVTIQDPLVGDEPLAVWATDSGPESQTALQPRVAPADKNALRYDAGITVGERRWQVVCVALPGYRQEPGAWSNYLLLILGLLLTIVIALYLQGSAAHAQRLLVVNRRLTDEIEHCQRVESELARHQSHLEELVAERTRQLEESRAALAQTERLASIGTLAAGIAHEMNTPLGTMMLAAENAMELRQKPGAGEMVENCLKRIVVEARRCGDAIRSVLLFARDEETQKWPVSFETVVRRSLELTDQYTRQHGATVNLDLPADLPLILANPMQMERVFINLIRNAIEAGRKGVRVGIRAEVAGETMRIVVEDNGLGIPEEHLPRVFDPFFTTRREQGGTGLGLSIVHGIIAEHGGKISVQSRVGTGTLFIIELPVLTADTSEVSDGQVADR